ncbi:MAG: hypothetical protein ACLQVY_23090 [Limisphaerales bacterium]
MKKTLLTLGLAGICAFAMQVKADTIFVVANGTGTYSTDYLAFYDANGNYLVLDGVHGRVTITYTNQTVLSFPYAQSVSGLTVTGTWYGTDEWDYAYTATVQEHLAQTTHSGSGRGGGYRSITTTSLTGGEITYDYAGAYAPPLVAPAVTGVGTLSSITLSWTSAGGGVPPYTYAVFDQNGVSVADTTGLTATISGLTPVTWYSYILLTTDSAGRQISTSVSAYTGPVTLNTVYTYNPANNSVTATWDADPLAVSYSVFYYDWALGVWIDGADTSGTTATVSGWSPNVDIPFYIAAYDVNGLETDFDQELVSVQPPPPPTHHRHSDD